MPRMWPFGLCVTAAMFWLALRNWSGSQDRAPKKDQTMARKVDIIRMMAASATDSVHAGAELQYMMPIKRCKGWLNY